MRRKLFQVSIALLLGAPVAVAALPPSSDEAQNSPGPTVRVASQSHELGAKLGAGMSEEATMFLAGTLLIGAAAMVRRSA